MQQNFLDHWDWRHYAFVLAILIIICIHVIRAIFSIPHILRHMKAQTKLLGIIARQGMHPEGWKVVDKVLKEAEPNQEAYEKL